MEIDFDAHGGQLLFPFLMENQGTIYVPPARIEGFNLIAGLDYGTRNPSAFEVLSVDYDGLIQVIWEYYEEPRRPDESDEQFRARKGYKVLSQAIKSCPYFSRNLVIWADPSLWNKTQEGDDPKGLKSVADLFAQEKVFLSPGQKGQDFACYEKLVSNVWKDPASPGLTIMQNCPWLWWELQRLRFADFGAATQANRNLQEKIVDKDNHCYSYDTDILTETGWKRFYDLTDRDKVATWAGDNGLIAWETPEEILEYDYDGVMCSLESGNLDFCVTPNHKMWVANQVDVIRKQSPKYSRRAISEIDKVMWVCKSGRSQYQELDWPDSQIAWYGFWLAEGCKSKNHRGSYYAHIDQKNADKETTEMLNAAGRHSKRVNKRGVVRYSYGKKFYDLVKDQGCSYEKFIPLFLKKGSVRQLKLLIYWMIKGDGTKNDRMWRYNTTSRQMADDFQEICFKAGYVSRLSIQANRVSVLPSGEKCQGRIVYHVSIQRGRKGQRGNGKPSVLAQIKKGKLLWGEYKGKVYCVNTKAGVIVVRRNGIPMWCGQSWDAFKYAVMTIPAFTKIPKKMRTLAEMRIDYLEKGSRAEQELRAFEKEAYQYDNQFVSAYNEAFGVAVEMAKEYMPTIKE
jgi:hypothetical protein